MTDCTQKNIILLRRKVITLLSSYYKQLLSLTKNIFLIILLKYTYYEILEKLIIIIYIVLSISNIIYTKCIAKRQISHLYKNRNVSLDLPHEAFGVSVKNMFDGEISFLSNAETLSGNIRAYL